MQENVPVLLVLSVCDKEIILEKGEILWEKRHCRTGFTKLQVGENFLQMVRARLGACPVLCEHFWRDTDLPCNVGDDGFRSSLQIIGRETKIAKGTDL
jgi:hypothetical protein